jgi:hypothetical protein
MPSGIIQLEYHCKWTFMDRSGKNFFFITRQCGLVVLLSYLLILILTMI